MPTTEERLNALETLVIMLLKQSRQLSACVETQRQLIEESGVFRHDDFVARFAAIEPDQDALFAAEFAEAQATAHAGSLLEAFRPRDDKPQ